MKHLPYLAVLARNLFGVLLLVFPFANAAPGQSVDRDKGQPNVVWIMSEDNSKHYLELFDPDGFVDALFAT